MCVGLLLTPATPKWPGEGIYIGHQVELAICSRCPIFYVGVGLTGGVPLVQPVTLYSEVAVGLLTCCHANMSTVDLTDLGVPV